MRFKAVVSPVLAIVIAMFFVTASASAQESSLKLVGFGDSLMAGYQLPTDDALPNQLEAALRSKGVSVSVANAGVSGDTSSGGLARIDWSVPDGTDGVILELGANDALRGIAPQQTEKNLEAMIVKLKDRNIPVLLVGMIAPPNMGGDYAERFNPIYRQLADKYDLAYYPFILEGVVGHPNLQLEDGMHPNTDGVGVVVQQMLPTVEQFVSKILGGEK
ncbi:arylesterase [Agrobacterium sp. ES01]|uniref:arylesterase n=1 Tax=Agrobacterium sp. ES01 TaxID=3420714 RepID=UPI003D0B28E0